MKKSYRIIAGILMLLITALGVTSCTRPTLERFEDTRSLMDTFVTIIVYSPNQETADAAMGAAFTRMEEIEKEASIFDEASEAFQLNRDGYLEAPSDDLLELINMSLDYHQIADGYFDITVQPLLDLWQAGLWQERESVQRSRISETLRLVGSDKIAIEGSQIRFTVDGMKITLGGIAKGYAVDEALVVLKDMGVKHALVNAGGDVGTLGSKPDGEPWTISLVNPDNTSESLANFSFSSRAVATSGNYERYFDPNKEVHHIINPKTGYSAQESISVTVIAENSTMADALATGVFVMGPETGRDLIESTEDVECLIVAADRTTIYLSSGIPKYMKESEQDE